MILLTLNQCISVFVSVCNYLTLFQPVQLATRYRLATMPEFPAILRLLYFGNTQLIESIEAGELFESDIKIQATAAGFDILSASLHLNNKLRTSCS